MNPQDLLIDTTNVVVDKLPTGLIPWLPKPHQCSCGSYCYADVGYVQSQAMVMDIWRCPDCSARYFRNGEMDLTGEI